MLHKKSRRIIPCDDLWPVEIELPAARRPGGNGLHKCIRVEPLLFRISERFTYSREGSGDHDLVCQLTVLPAARLTLIIDIRPHRLKKRMACFIVLALTAHEDGKCSLLRPCITAGHRRVQHMEASLRAFLIDFF